jgi:hypothetical protein
MDTIDSVYAKFVERLRVHNYTSNADVTKMEKGATFQSANSELLVQRSTAFTAVWWKEFCYGFDGQYYCIFGTDKYYCHNEEDFWASFEEFIWT